MGLYCTLTLEDSRDPNAGPNFKIGRNWDMLNFLFSKTGGAADNQIAEFLVSDWEELAPEACRIPPSEVASIAFWLGTIDNDAVIGEFEPAAMAVAGVYDSDLALARPDDYLIELTDLLVGLREFLARANLAGASIVRVIC